MLQEPAHAHDFTMSHRLHNEDPFAMYCEESNIGTTNDTNIR